MIYLHDLILQRGQKRLLEQADLLIHSGQKIGLVGANGSGKTSLFLLLHGDLSCQQGEITLPKQLAIAHLKQDIPTTSLSAVAYTLQGDKDYVALQQALHDAEARQDGIRLAELHHRLADMDGYAIPSKAAKILTGLGFSTEELEKSVCDFSGGWRMRLNLAQVLMARADLLLLDEPTNHLDLEAIIWLETWLKQSSQTVLLISHDREFLDRTVTHIVHLEAKKLTNYAGNYSAFEKQRAEQLAIQQATYKKQVAYSQHLQKFVDKFRYKASKAKQAQCRVRMLERIQWVAPVHAANPFQFSFKPIQHVSSALLQLKHAHIGYADKIILKQSDVTIYPGDRIGLIGPNGAGKSTLIRVLAQQLALQSGEKITHSKVKIGYFAQHQLEYLEAEKSPFDHVQALNANVQAKDIRQYLGGFNFRGDDVFRTVQSFSGGEKARLALALLIWHAPNLLLLDEPTNHLDLEMREALNVALQTYDGALVVVSHDRYFLKSVTNELWLIAQGRVKPFNGDLDDYQTWLRDQLKKTPIEKTPVKPVKKSSESNQQIKKLEKKLDQYESALSELDAMLNDNTLYDEVNKEKLSSLLEDRQALVENIAQLEEKILRLL